ncbi:MAG: hypothetical protein CMF74_00650 [Maricaulis sp.]|jgi:DUF971 family protein|nr:hypothetical protein [Maricaulis sp.]HAQ35369.1 hypothetical protein [Alphaproteobacteria bacterium]
MTPRAWPSKLDFNSAQRALIVTYDDGSAQTIAFRTLRTESPSAEVQGHGPGQKKTVTGKDKVGVTAANLIGRYAVQIVFDDGHDSGIFSWDYLRELGERG